MLCDQVSLKIIFQIITSHVPPVVLTQNRPVVNARQQDQPSGNAHSYCLTTLHVTGGAPSHVRADAACQACHTVRTEGQGSSNASA